MMQIKCEDRERIFLDGSAEEWAALEFHASSCAECAKEVRAWKSLSVAAEELRDYQEIPALWPRIESALAQQAGQSVAHKPWLERLSFWRSVPTVWQTALAGALVLLLAVTAGYLVLHRRPTSGPDVVTHNPLLKDSKVAEVERAERDYMKAIDKLAAEAKPQLNAPDSPLMANYREKLMMLDGAIDELRMQAGQNPSNAHLRYQLLSMYQEKQSTLQEVLETKP
ncbi:MAG TPA: hypothetical protein VGF61_15365 [Candidatus Acidoferrum sp.]|jgi:hypothetical protein